MPTPGVMTSVSVTYEYDGNGNLISSTDGNGNVTTFEYDAMNRLLSIDYPGGNSPDVSFAFDENGNLTNMTDSTGTTIYGHDLYDRLTGIDYPDGNFVRYGYDDAGDIIDLQYGNWLTFNDSGLYTYIHYEFNEDNRISSVQNVFTSDSTIYTYDAAGNISRRTLPNGAYTDYTYDNDGRLITVEHHRQNGSLICKYKYTLDSTGNRTQVVETAPPITRTTRYTYDAVGYLDSVTYPDGRFVSYGYDSFGNRTRMTETIGRAATTREYVYDNDSRLLSTTLDGVPEENFYYDNTGNLIQRMCESDGRQIDYVYDYENRLVRYTDSTNSVEYVYNGIGQRVAKIVNGVRTNFINDPNRAYVQVLAETNNNGAVQRAYEWGNELINQEDVNGSARCYYLHDSVNGSVRRLIDANQSVVNSYEYDAFGKVTSEVEKIANDYQFHGEVQEEETELLFLRARYMDPEQGRFLSRDPIDGDLKNPFTFNKYVWVINDPINRTDPSGWWSPSPIFDPLDILMGAFIGFFGEGGRINYSLTRGWSITGGTRAALGLLKGGMRSSIFGKAAGMYRTILKHPAAARQGLKYWGFAGPLVSMYVFAEVEQSRQNGDYVLKHTFDSVGLFLPPGVSEAHTLVSHAWDVLSTRPGGVALNKTAEILLDINEITGATYDADTGQIIVYGKKDSSSIGLPPMSIDDLAVAFRAVNLGTMPVVSIEDPVVSSPSEWPGRECYTVRYGPLFTNSDTGEQKILDVSSKTHFGWVMFEADRHMKCLGLGRDNRTGDPVSSNVPGFHNLMDLLEIYWDISKAEFRFWFSPKEIVVKPSADGKSMELKKVAMQLSTETMFSSEGQTEGTPPCEHFARHFTEHYDELAAEQIIYDDTGNPHYIFKELKQLAAIVGIVQWVKENNIPMDLSFLGQYTPVYYHTSAYTPKMSLQSQSSSSVYHYLVYGGVNYCTDLDLGTGADPAGLAATAHNARRDETELSWTFSHDGEISDAIALSVDRKKKYGGFSHSAIDASLKVNGVLSLFLARHFDSFNVTPSIFGWGWKAQPYALEFKGNRQQFNLCAMQWEGFGEVWFIDRFSEATYKFVPSGTYNTLLDPVGIASRFDPNESILVYRYENKEVPGLLFSDNKTRMIMRLADGILLDFDLGGRLIRTEDRNGNIIEYKYDASKRLISIGQHSSRAISFTYDTQDRVATAVLPDGHSVTYIYDANGNLSSAHGGAPNGRLLQYSYDADRNLTEVQDEDGNAIGSRRYDIYGRVTEIVQPGIATPLMQNHNLANKTSHLTGPESFSQTLEFNDNFDLIRVTDSRGNSSEMTYNAYRDVISETTADRSTKEHYFDYRGNQVATVRPNGRADIIFLDHNNNPLFTMHSFANENFVKSFDADHVLILPEMDIDTVDLAMYSYDSKGNLTMVIDANGRLRTYGYDSTGNRIWEKDGRGHQTSYSYDEYSHLTYVNNELGHEVSFLYDQQDNVLQVAIAAGHVDYTYDDKNHLESVIWGDPGVRHTVSYTYDAKGQIKTVTDPAEVVTEYDYDERGNLTRITHDGVVRSEYQYDGLNRLKAIHYNGTAGSGNETIVSRPPIVDIKANGSDDPIVVSTDRPVSITVSLEPRDHFGQNADWWIAASTPFDWYSYVYPSGWLPGINRCIEMPLFDLPSIEIVNMNLLLGDYIFFFAVDDNADGIPNATWLDSVEVRVK
jgi:RHS repeat-associated protein